MKKQGFTLLELLVVISIIGFLTTIGITALANAQAQARDTVRFTNIQNLIEALDLYYDEHDSYPSGAGVILGYEDPQGFVGSGFTCLDLQNGFLLNNCPTPIINYPPDPIYINTAQPENVNECWITSAAPCYTAYQFLSPETYFIHYGLETNNDFGDKGYYVMNEIGVTLKQ